MANRTQNDTMQEVIEVGCVESIFRYPVKSMAGERMETAEVGWHGLEGDRRLGLRRFNDCGGFPWLSAGRLPELLLFSPRGMDTAGMPAHIHTPDGTEMPVFGEELAAEIGRRFGAPVEMMLMRQGIFDEGSISVIATGTVGEIARLAGVSTDPRRFRPNVVVRSLRGTPFEEDGWVGSVLSFGENDSAAEITVTLRDERCGMLNLDPDTALPETAVMKTVVRVNENHAGVYATVTRRGRIVVGQKIFLRPA